MECKLFTVLEYLRTGFLLLYLEIWGKIQKAEEEKAVAAL